MKISEIWEAIEDQRPKDIKIIDWRQSYDAVKSAIEYVGYEMITSKEEFIDIPIPIDRRGCKCYINRKIIIKRDGIQSILTRIDQILTKTFINWLEVGLEILLGVISLTLSIIQRMTMINFRTLFKQHVS